MGPIPSDLITSSTSMPSYVGVSSVTIMARTTTYSGNFFSPGKTDESIRSQQTWLINVALTADTWRHDVASNATYRQLLIDAVLVPYYNSIMI